MFMNQRSVWFTASGLSRPKAVTHSTPHNLALVQYDIWCCSYRVLPSIGWFAVLENTSILRLRSVLPYGLLMPSLSSSWRATISLRWSQKAMAVKCILRFRCQFHRPNLGLKKSRTGPASERFCTNRRSLPMRSLIDLLVLSSKKSAVTPSTSRMRSSILCRRLSSIRSILCIMRSDCDRNVVNKINTTQPKLRTAFYVHMVDHKPKWLVFYTRRSQCAGTTIFDILL